MFSFISLYPNSICIPALLCHGGWESEDETNHLILSSTVSTLGPDTSPLHYCLSYKEQDGRVEGSLVMSNCSLSPEINITSSGPCILPLTGSDTGTGMGGGPPQSSYILLNFILIVGVIWLS